MAHKQQFLQLLRYGAPYKKTTLFSFLLMLLGTAATLYAPLQIKSFIDDHVIPGQWDSFSLTLIGVSFVVANGIAAATAWLNTVLFQKIALNIVHDIREQVFAHVLRLPMVYFDQEPVGKLVSRITNDTEAIRDMFVQALPSMLNGVVVIAGVVMAMFVLDSRLAWFSLAILPLIVLTIYLYQKMSHSVLHRSRAILSDINSNINEKIQGMAVVQVFRQQRRMAQQFESICSDYSLILSKIVVINGLLLRPMVHLASALALALLVGGFATSPVLEVGLLYAFIRYLDLLFEPLTQVTMQMQVWQQSVVSAERVFTLLDEPVEASLKVQPKALLKTGKIEFRQVGLSYDGKHQALDGISFTVEPGQFVALVGHTGSGKSSIVNLLMRFYPWQQGDILMDNQPLQVFPEVALRNHLGLVFQEPFIFDGTIADNIALGKGLAAEKLQAHAQLMQASHFIKRLPNGFDTELGEQGQSLSSGERQLLSLVRTMAHNHSVLLMDEATANIDSETEAAIKQGLSRLRQGRTTLAIAHRLATVEDADLILVLDKGRIIQRGTHKTLTQQPGLYLDMFRSQQGELSVA